LGFGSTPEKENAVCPGLAGQARRKSQVIATYDYLCGKLGLGRNRAACARKGSIHNKMLRIQGAGHVHADDSASTPWPSSASRDQARATSNVLVDELITYRIRRDFGVAAHSHLFENASAIRAHRFHAQPELVRHDCRGYAASNSREHLELSF
jgi:hypothetical protein